ncbi:MAG: 2-isopropylmalate synthase, partial [Smithella sp.]
MAKINSVTKTAAKKLKIFKLKELEEPNLYKEIFPYSEVSKIVFDNKVVPLRMAKEIFITDTTFRDGQQSRPPYTAEQIVNIFQLLSKLGGPNGVIRQSEFFLYSKKDKEAVEKCLELGLPYPEITSWIRA